eukprot:CAMPEP_0173182952 /NCGR_PEP_ID=MMETSP1141-20130122/8128_1 /TAXON_ID=483371 /ORGANISM="non described non described, Strain CCMP2298" /LENGTH=406 /DNA_ID=CAMNT_0014106113 /DNA_START=25 /DNA_END=1242 /DNA_ORIENTATION=+
MALSVVNFRMHHGNTHEQVTFSGNWIKLLDLKKEILDKKKISGSLDFDLKIVDEKTSKEYKEDDETVPKNSTVVVKRIPSKNSLIARLNNRNTRSGGAGGPQSSEIVMPMKVQEAEEEPFPTPITAAITPIAEPVKMEVAEVEAEPEEDEDNILKLLEEEETVLRRTVPVSAWSSDAAPAPVPGVRPPPALRGRGAGGFLCNRCLKPGHIAKHCPTSGNTAFDPEIRLMNVPRTGRRKVSTLEGIDTTTSTVIEHADGSFEVFEATSASLLKLNREAALTGMDLSSAPTHLKCALTGALLREAVATPCCGRCVNDSAVRAALLASALQCPLCQSGPVSPDSLQVRKDLRAEVENFIDNYARQQEEGGAGAAPIAPHAHTVPTVSHTLAPAAPPLPAGPPPVPPAVT